MTFITGKLNTKVENASHLNTITTNKNYKNKNKNTFKWSQLNVQDEKKYRVLLYHN